MNYYFISSNQQRFTPFQESISALGDSYLVDEVSQLQDALPEKNSQGVFFIHLNEPQKFVEEFVKEIRKRSKSALIIHVMEDSKGFDLKKHQTGPSGGDSYVSMKSNLEFVQEVLEGLGVLAEDAPPQFDSKNLDSEFSNLDGLARFANHAMSKEIDSVFRHLVKDDPKKKAPAAPAPVAEDLSGASMSDNDENDSGLSLISDFGDLSLSDGTDDVPSAPVDEGMDLVLTDDLVESDGLSLADDLPPSDPGELSLTGVDSGDLGSDLDDLDLSDTPDLPDDNGLKLSDNIPTGEGLDLGLDDPLADSLDDSPIDFTGASLGDDDLSEDAKEKLREIDVLMESTSSQIMISPDLGEEDDDSDIDIAPPLSAKSNLDESLVADDLDLASLDFSGDQKDLEEEEEEEEKPKKKKKEEKPVKEVREAKEAAAPQRESGPTARQMGADLREISGAYTAEMERAQATISNLRADRQELLNKIQVMEEDKILHNRQTLTIRSELDERKIELSIVRKKLNEEISELKDRLKLHDERRLILEEKNRILSQELDKASQRNKIDIKKVQIRERELEQKLELLKSDAETQIRHRDLKILELKRKIDAMEFDMESIQVQEKKSVESRYELEDKLDKAIKTLRNAITVLEDESDRESAVQALKKNIDV